jgi:hypothetical protein
MLKPNYKKDKMLSMRLSEHDEHAIDTIQEYLASKVSLMRKASKGECVLVAIRTMAQHIEKEKTQGKCQL